MIEDWVCAHDPKCEEIGCRCEPPDEYDYSYELGYFCENESLEVVKEFAAKMAQRAFEDGYKEGHMQAVAGMCPTCVKLKETCYGCVRYS